MALGQQLAEAAMAACPASTALRAYSARPVAYCGNHSCLSSWKMKQPRAAFIHSWAETGPNVWVRQFFI